MFTFKRTHPKLSLETMEEINKKVAQYEIDLAATHKDAWGFNLTENAHKYRLQLLEEEYKKINDEKEKEDKAVIESILRL